MLRSIVLQRLPPPPPNSLERAPVWIAERSLSMNRCPSRACAGLTIHFLCLFFCTFFFIVGWGVAQLLFLLLRLASLRRCAAAPVWEARVVEVIDCSEKEGSRARACACVSFVPILTPSSFIPALPHTRFFISASPTWIVRVTKGSIFS